MTNGQSNHINLLLQKITKYLKRNRKLKKTNPEASNSHKKYLHKSLTEKVPQTKSQNNKKKENKKKVHSRTKLNEFQ